MCYLLHRLQSSQDAPTGYEILKLATKGSASLLGRSDIGSLEVGKCADLFLDDGRRLGLVAPHWIPAPSSAPSVSVSLWTTPWYKGALLSGRAGSASRRKNLWRKKPAGPFTPTFVAPAFFPDVKNRPGRFPPGTKYTKNGLQFRNPHLLSGPCNSSQDPV